MKTSRSSLGFASVLATIGLFSVPAAAHADTYQIYDLGAGSRTFDVGITASGTAVLVYDLPSGEPPCKIQHLCKRYETFVDGVIVNESPTPPNLSFDNGTSCTVSAPFLTSPAPGTCNNGHEVFIGSTPASYTDETFTGPDPVADLFAAPPLAVSDVDLNASGDFVYNLSHPTGNGGEYLEAIDLTTTPEPGSIVLLATGVIAVAGTLRRRLSRLQ